MNWEVGKTYGNFKFVSATSTEATFETSEGKTVTYPNIFQEKTPAQMAALQKSSGKANSKPHKIHKIRKIREDASEETLEQAAAALQAKLAKLKKIKA